METRNGLSNLKNPAYTGKNLPFHPFPFPPDSSSIAAKGNFKYGENTNYRQCCSTEGFLDEQPSWLEDLLKDPESPVQRGHHQRSASDSFAYLEEAAETFTECEESKHVAYFRPPAVPQNLLNYKDSGRSSVKSKGTSDIEKNSQEPEDRASALYLEHSRDESRLQSLEGPAAKDAGFQAKPAGPKSDSKRKQHNAQRSRVRKLQYIAQLEEAVEMLKAEGSGLPAELEFLEHQNMILTMENRAMKQRLESIAQEQLIKQWEQGMLEREIARLQTLYHQQKQQHMHMHMQQQQQQQNIQMKQFRNKSRDLDHQENTSFVKKN